MPFPVDLHLYITLCCNAACRMCNMGCSPERDEQMRLDDARRYVEDTLRLGDIETFVITGGEPLLRSDDVCEIAQYAGSHGLKTRVSTNAFWGALGEDASALVGRLKRAGVVHLWMSTDAFHAEFVPFLAVRNAVRAAMQEGMAFYVQSTYLFPESDLFGAGGMYDGPVHSDYDRRTRAIQEQLSALCPAGTYGWGRVIFKARAVSLRDCLGEDLVRAEDQLAKALDSLANYGAVVDRLAISVFPDGTMGVNQNEIGRVPEGGVDAGVTEWCSRKGIPL